MTDTIKKSFPDESLRLFTQNIKKIPTIPAVADKIIEIVGSRAAYIGNVVETIEKDPAISSKVLSLANAAFFRKGTPVLTIRDAVMKIGFDNIRGIALGISLLTVFKGGNAERVEQYSQIFRHCLAVGFISREIERQLNDDGNDDVFTSGLLHDLGLLVAHSFLPDIFDQVQDRLKRGRRYVDAERDVYGFDHGDIGAWLADKWRLPDVIRDAVYYHHDVAGAEYFRKNVAIVHIADYIAVRKGYSPIRTGGYEYELEGVALDALGISRFKVSEMETFSDEALSAIQTIDW
jgi:putative nucleotidyltransferase with HDIG domain